jgi:putative ATP-dependent RNA helicase
VPSIAGLLQKKKYFCIIDQDEDHPKKHYFDIVCFELLKDNPVYHEIKYLDKPFFTGLVEFEKDPTNEQFIPFKFWKRKVQKKVRKKYYNNSSRQPISRSSGNPEDATDLSVLDPDTFRHFITNAKFIVVGDNLNKPQGHDLDNYQAIDSEAHEVQKKQMSEYMRRLKPIYDYLGVLQYDEIRSYLFCRSCKNEKRYILIDDETKYKNQAFYVCRKCAATEVIQSIKKKFEVTSTLKIYLRDLLKKYRDVVKVMNVFSPNFNVIDHPEATLVGVKKKKVKFNRKNPQSIFDFDLPYPLIHYFSLKNRTFLLPAQIMALENGLLERQDELIVSSTSSGKTMIGEIAGISKIILNKIDQLAQKKIPNPFKTKEINQLIKHNQYGSQNSKFVPLIPKLNKNQNDYIQLLKNTVTKKKMLYLVPIVALANMRHREYKELGKIGVNSSLRVGISHISQRKKKLKQGRNFSSADVIIATYEAIDIILRTSHPYLLKDVKTIVIDEIQMLADPERGFILDGIIARLRLYLPKAQMLYLSATISDPQELANHLRTALVHYQDRPVPIERHMIMCIDENVKIKNLRLLVQNEFKNKSSFGFRGQSIIFTNSRKNTEKIAEYLNKNEIKAASYHGGMNTEQRKFVERHFEKQTFACVATTAALAAGVDFAVSQVIFFNLTMGIQWITVADFEQMGGRAGRLKKHDAGKVYLLIMPGKTYTGSQNDTEEKVAARLLKGQIEPLKLEPNEDAQYSEILAAIAMFSTDKDRNKGITMKDLDYYHLMLYNGDFDLKTAITQLLLSKFIQYLPNKKDIRVTKFGQAVAESFFSLEIANTIRKVLTQKVTEKNPAPNMLELAGRFNKFKNAYLTNRIISAISTRNQRSSRSNNLFSSSVLGLVSADSLKSKKNTINRRVYHIILAWSEHIFNCSCSDAPYCDCGRNNLERLIMETRMQGTTIKETIMGLEEAFEIQVYHGDLIDYLESIIYTLLSISKIGRSLNVPPQTMLKIRGIKKLVSLLIGPIKN